MGDSRPERADARPRAPAIDGGWSAAPEDTPRSLTYQLDLLKAVGFSAVDVLHKHGCFAAFGGMRAT